MADTTATKDDAQLTPEMITAGVFELMDYSEDLDLGSELVERIYRAMWRVRGLKEAENG